MKVVQINATCGVGSTGKICVAIAKLLDSRCIENYILYSAGTNTFPSGKKYMSKWEVKLQALCARIFGNYGFNSVFATKRMLRFLDEIQPDVVHLHNLHGHNCHLGMLLRYLSRKHIRVIWTFHDCWAFTGYCMNFVIDKCDRWQTVCGQCPQRKQYSFFLDRAAGMFKRKKKLLSNVDLTIVTPSRWLADLTRKSFLKEFPIKVINNGIDLSVFKPVASNFREQYGIPNDKKIVLGVAFGWDARKGLDVFLTLAKRLHTAEYQIVLVGTNDSVDKVLPNNVISIHRTADQGELARIYAVADVFVNPTREENYPTVNMEAIACGTPVVTFKTGGSPEILDETTGIVVECDDIDGMEQAIRYVCNEIIFSTERCLERACSFNQDDRFNGYLALYVASSE